jgi:hypothetical protein
MVTFYGLRVGFETRKWLFFLATVQTGCCALLLSVQRMSADYSPDVKKAGTGS